MPGVLRHILKEIIISVFWLLSKFYVSVENAI